MATQSDLKTALLDSFAGLIVQKTSLERQSSRYYLGSYCPVRKAIEEQKSLDPPEYPTAVPEFPDHRSPPRQERVMFEWL